MICSPSFTADALERVSWVAVMPAKEVSIFIIKTLALFHWKYSINSIQRNSSPAKYSCIPRPCFAHKVKSNCKVVPSTEYPQTSRAMSGLDQGVQIGDPEILQLCQHTWRAS